jgi:hypothetical protein
MYLYSTIICTLTLAGSPRTSFMLHVHSHPTYLYNLILHANSNTTIASSSLKAKQYPYKIMIQKRDYSQTHLGRWSSPHLLPIRIQEWRHGFVRATFCYFDFPRIIRTLCLKVSQSLAFAGLIVFVPLHFLLPPVLLPLLLPRLLLPPHPFLPLPL